MKLNYEWSELIQHPEDKNYYETNLFTPFGTYTITVNHPDVEGKYGVHTRGIIRPRKIVESIEEGKEWVNKQLIEKTELVLETIVKESL